MGSPKVEITAFQEADDFDDDDFYSSSVKTNPAPQNYSSNPLESPASASATFSLPIPGLNIEPISSLAASLASGNGSTEVDDGQMQTHSDPAVSAEKASTDKHEEAAPFVEHEEQALPDEMDITQNEISVNMEATEKEIGAAATDAPATKPDLDPEFLRAAEENKDNEDAEWQFDPSDAVSSESSESDSSSNSSDEDSSEQDSDEDSDEDSSDGSGVLLTPAEQARILMEGTYEDGPITSAPLRTHNEKPEEFKPKPNFDITPAMRITELGHVQSVIDNYIMVAANTSGEYAVLESESVLCLQDRTVLGVVHETIGQVQSPIYLIGYNTVEEVKETGVAKGTKVFYVDAHSKFVFTQEIQKSKGTDASNVFDEPVAEEEMAFSDDEEEQAFKRQRKADRKEQAMRESQDGVYSSNSSQPQRRPQRPTGIAANSSQQTAYPTTMKYDDDDDADSDQGMYKPLARPDNLHEMMIYGAPEERLPRSVTNGRGRGRGDRQWVDRGRGGRGRGGRGRGNDAGAYPQRHDNARRGRGGYRGQDQRRSLPARPEQSASPQPSAFPWIPPMVNGVPIPPPIGMPFQFGQQGMPAFPMPSPVPQNNFQNGGSFAQFPPNFMQLFAKFQQQATQLPQQTAPPVSQHAQTQPFPQWSQAPIPPPVAPYAWSEMQLQQPQQPQQQSQQHLPQQAGPSNAQLEELLRTINANKPKQ
ncbi:DNA mismatch repair protein [Venturia nashicola]|uniref:H/ACA ribonucleoprotein complex non-core subunit NAF1 n=1 Tax=Venturia nashicola TaxID=86259 RepID=A0A4Z1PB80_9PEZI|nr:DNA mismatch repair protein [Venturia nashicola]TLD35064.1 DNA mismatch repair protein [Venturia nashicola]